MALLTCVFGALAAVVVFAGFSAAQTDNIATLASLDLSNIVLSPPFDPEVESYSAVEATAQTTITAVPSDSRAMVGYDSSDADQGTPGHQVDLNIYFNQITITVTAADAVTTKTYVVSVRRGLYVHKFASEFDAESQGVLTDSDQSNNWRYMWRESFDFDGVSPTYACERTGSAVRQRKCQAMPVLTTPPVRALRWLDYDTRSGWIYQGVGVDRLRGWHPRPDKRVVVGWTSTYDRSMYVDITGLARREPAQGNVRVAIYRGDNELVGWTTLDSANPERQIGISDVLLHPGDELFFMVDAGGTDFGDDVNDRTLWDPTILANREVDTVHVSSAEYRNEQANLVNDVRSDDWLYEYKYSITDRTPTNRTDSQNRPGAGQSDLPVTWSPDNSRLFRLETPWNDPTYTQPSQGTFGASWLDRNDIHTHDIGSGLWGIGMWSRSWTGVGHNLHVGSDWMQPVHGMDAVKTWVHTYPESKLLQMTGTVELKDTSVSGQGAVRLLIIVTDSSTGQGTTLWDQTSDNRSSSYVVTASTNPGDRVHFIAHQVNTHQNGTWEGRTHSDAHAVDWDPAVAVSQGSELLTPEETLVPIEYPPSVSTGGISYRVLQDNGELLSNPGTGLQHAIYDNFLQHYGGGTPPSDTLDWFEGMTSVYIRVPWSFIQQKDNEYVWTRVDEILDYWGLKGKRAGFRFSTLESEHQATPLYIEESGASGSFLHVRQFFGLVWVPGPEDIIFQREYGELLEAFAERYGDDPRVDYVEMGSIGRWGEGHSVSFDLADARNHANLYINAFADTHIRVLWPDDLSGGNTDIANIAPINGFGVFDDSISFATWGLRQVEQVWRNALIRVEYGQLFERDWWIDANPNRVFRTLEAYHGSYYFPHAFPDRFIEWYPDLARAAGRRIGYRFNVTDAHWQEAAPPGEPAWFDLGLRNAGIAPNYDGGHVGIVLMSGDRTVETVYAGFNTADLPVASTQLDKVGYTDTEVVRLRIPVQIPADFPVGEADVAVFVRRPSDYSIRDRNIPRPVVGDWLDRPWEYYELPYDNRVEHGDNAFSYIIGKIQIAADATATHLSLLPGVSPVRVHSYSEQYSHAQGDLDDSLRSNDWTYHSSEARSVRYQPLFGPVSNLEYRTIGDSTGWLPSSGTAEYPIIGRDERHFIHPHEDHDAVVTWTNTTGGTIDVIASGTVTKHHSSGNGIRVSLVVTATLSDTRVLWGPIKISQSGPVPFNIATQVGAGDEISLVVNAISQSDNDGASIENFVVVSATDATHIVPSATAFDLSYRAYDGGDLDDRNRNDDWTYNYTDVPAGDYTPLDGTILDMNWKYHRGWTPGSSPDNSRIGTGWSSSSWKFDSDEYYTTNLIQPDNGRDAVLTWKNTRPGTTPVVVYGAFDRIDGDGGDGTRISVVRNTDNVLWTGTNSGGVVRMAAATRVVEGDEIHLVVNAINNTTDDTIRLDYAIVAYEGLDQHTHTYRHEYSFTSQGNTDNDNIRDDWRYLSVAPSSGEYRPMNGTVAELEFRRSGTDSGWVLPDGGFENYPKIGGDPGFNYVHPTTSYDMVISWQNTSETVVGSLGGSVTVSGMVHGYRNGVCSGDNQDGIRFSIVKNNNTVLFGPLTISDTDLVAFSVSTSIVHDDQINLVVNQGPLNQRCDDTRLYGLTIHRYPTQATPRVTTNPP